MNKKLLTLLLLAGIAVIFCTTGLHAGSEYPDKVVFDTEGIIGKGGKLKDKYPKLVFNHTAHSDDYGYTCGQCHHDDKRKAIEGLKKGDDVQKCIECHSNLDIKDKSKDSYYKSMHSKKGSESCSGCHKAYNKKKKLKSKDKGAAPTSCNKCHKK
jgi:hypothetical protein